MWRQHPSSASNGALMRNGVVAGMGVTLDHALRMSIAHTLVTHWNPKTVACSFIHTWLIWNIYREPETSLESFPEAIFDEYWKFAQGPIRSAPWYKSWQYAVGEYALEVALGEVLEELEENVTPFDPFVDISESVQGYCIVTLKVALWAVHWASEQRTYPNNNRVLRGSGWHVLSWVAAVGLDSDTYGATAGPLVAAYMKDEPPPENLIKGLKAVEEFDKVLEGLAHAG